MSRYSLLSKIKTMMCTIISAILALPLAVLSGCASAPIKPFAQYSEYAVQAANEGSRADAKWADYLKTHFQKRATDRDCVLMGKAQDDSQLQIDVQMDSSMSADYAVEMQEHQIRLKARNEEAMLWLQYQFMSAVSAEDGRFLASDLPPAIISCKRDTMGTFAFEHRSLYTPTNTNADMMPILGVSNVDFDWGLWGHNLRKVFTDGIPTEAMALIDGKRNANQFCFSSAALYRAYENFVIDQYGDGSDGITTRFAVMPNDNGLVCQCEACRRAGNTAQSATPAVTALTERLARRFPKQMFFTSAYASTRTPASHTLPSNVGVMLSAIDLPLTTKVAEAKGHADFEKQAKAWSNVCRHVYVWDYMRNYDDYLTPYPCLHQLQARLRFYRTLGIKGIFFNGSGYDYASFDDVQTYTLAQLLINPDIDIDLCVQRFFASTYPKTGQMLARFYMDMESKATTATLPLYAGIDEALKLYLDPKALDAFIAQLDSKAKTTDEAERSLLNRLLTALAYTRLEVARSQTTQPKRAYINELTDLLSQHKAFDNMDNYRETDGSVEHYLQQWSTNYPWLTPSDNLLAAGMLQSGTPSDDIRADALTDGKQGFTTDYHAAWVITAAPTLRLTTRTALPSSISLQASLLHAPEWHIYAPAAIEIWQGGALKARTTISAPTQRQRVVASLTATHLAEGTPIEIRMTQTTANVGRKTMACDEIIIKRH